MHRKAPNSLTGKRKVRKTRVRPDATAGTFAPPVTHFQASFWALIKEERTGERKDCADFWYIPAMAPDLTLVLLTCNICWPAFLHACCALQCAHKATPFPSIQSLSMPHIGRMPRWMPRITKLNKARLGFRSCCSEVVCPLAALILYPSSWICKGCDKWRQPNPIRLSMLITYLDEHHYCIEGCVNILCKVCLSSELEMRLYHNLWQNYLV